MDRRTQILVMCLIYIIFLGDVREAINKIRRYVESESAFFNAFLEEGLRFSSSLYLCLIWIRILKHVFQYPKEAADHLMNHPFFKEFVAKPSTETYIDRLCESLQSVCIGSPVSFPKAKRRLSEMLDTEDDTETDTETTTLSIKRSRVTWHSESEEDASPSTSQIAPSSNKNKKKHKKTKKH